MRILISGAGIAGPTLAYWLARRRTAEITIVDKAPELRTDGYMIDFWGAGFEIADRMGLLPAIRREGYQVQRLRVVNSEGKEIAGFPVDAFAGITHGRFVSLPRGTLAGLIFEQIQGRVETIFGDSVKRISQSDQRVQVTFEKHGTQDFDLVVGADGLHSRIRELAFGPENQFEKYLGYKVAAFEVEGYKPRDELIYVLYTEVGQQVGRFTMRGNRTLFLFTFKDEDETGANDEQSQKVVLRKRFAKSGWECPQILEAMDSASTFYFDRVSQIRIGAESGGWARGRTVLLGDAAFCVSLLAGQGTSLAMVAAYILAGELHQAQGNYAQAFSRYEERFGPFVFKKQKAALRFAGSFAPKSRFSMFLRNQIFNLLRIGWIANLVVGRDLADHIELPDYH